MQTTFTHPRVPMLINDASGKTICRLNRDGSVELDWMGIEAKASEWTPGNHDQALSMCKLLVAVAERVRAETEARFVRPQS